MIMTNVGYDLADVTIIFIFHWRSPKVNYGGFPSPQDGPPELIHLHWTTFFILVQTFKMILSRHFSISLSDELPVRFLSEIFQKKAAVQNFKSRFLDIQNSQKSMDLYRNTIYKMFKH